MIKIFAALFFVTTLFLGFTSFLFVADSIDKETQLDCARELVEIYQSLAFDSEAMHDIDALHSWLKVSSPNYVKIGPNAIQAKCSLISYDSEGSLLEVTSQIEYEGFYSLVSVPQ